MMAAMLVMAACTSGNERDNPNLNVNTDTTDKPQAVQGRKNFGSEHALVTTPQPCVMNHRKRHKN